MDILVKLKLNYTIRRKIDELKMFQLPNPSDLQVKLLRYICWSCQMNICLFICHCFLNCLQAFGFVHQLTCVSGGIVNRRIVQLNKKKFLIFLTVYYKEFSGVNFLCGGLKYFIIVIQLKYFSHFLKRRCCKMFLCSCHVTVGCCIEQVIRRRIQSALMHTISRVLNYGLQDDLLKII